MIKPAHVFEGSKWVLTVAIPLLKLTEVFVPGHIEGETVRYAVFAVSAALPELLLLTAGLWAIELIASHWRAVISWFALPPGLWYGKPFRRRLLILFAFANVAYCVFASGLQGLGYLRARHRLYVHWFNSAFEQAAEREHLFHCLTWQYDHAASSLDRLNVYVERPDATRLDTRKRSLIGLVAYCNGLEGIGDFYHAKAAENARSPSDIDMRRAADYYCEVLAVSPSRAVVRERLRAISADVLSKEGELRALYRMHTDADDATLVVRVRSLRNYLFDTPVSTKISAMLQKSSSAEAAGMLRTYFRSFSSEDAFIKAARQSWRIDLIASVIARSKECETELRSHRNALGDVGRMLMRWDLPNYARAAFRSEMGLRALTADDERYFIRSLALSEGSQKAIELMKEYIGKHPRDMESRLCLAGAVSDDRQVLEALLPFGAEPGIHAVEIARLRANAHQSLKEYGAARVEALKWRQTHEDPVSSLLLWGESEVGLGKSGRVQTLLEVLMSFVEENVSLDKSNDREETRMTALCRGAIKLFEAESDAMPSNRRIHFAQELYRFSEWLEREIDSELLVHEYLQFAHTLDPNNRFVSLMWIEGIEDTKVLEGETILPESYPPELQSRVRQALQRLKEKAAEK